MILVGLTGVARPALFVAASRTGCRAQGYIGQRLYRPGTDRRRLSVISIGELRPMNQAAASSSQGDAEKAVVAQSRANADNGLSATAGHHLPLLDVPIWLGSKSASRREIMDDLAAKIGFTYSTVTADIDEKEAYRSSDPEDLVMKLAEEKANAILRKWAADNRIPDKGVLITADQVVTNVNWAGRILEKPETSDEAKLFIRGYSGGTCRTVGSVRALNLQTGKVQACTETCSIHFHEIPEDIIDRIVAGGEVLYCAGGLMVEHDLIQPYLKGVDGNLDAVMGLGSETVLTLLRKVISQ